MYFTDLPQPARKTYTVLVVEAKSTDHCQQMQPICNEAGKLIGSLHCMEDADEIYECPCCGRMMCDTHMSQVVAFHGELLCLHCALLSQEGIDKIQQLREALNTLS